MPASAPSSLPVFDRLWLTEAVRLREEQAGALDDAEANRQARRDGGDLAALVQARALWLARRDGLDQALYHWRQGAGLAGWALALLAMLSGAGLAASALGDGSRPVNAFWALGSLLGLNLLTLLGWLLGLLFAGRGAGALGRLWLWLSEKLARDARALQLAPALLNLLERRQLARWWLGSAVHGFWLLAMLSALFTLLALLATRRYGFVWETTILAPDTFIRLTQLLGALPAWLGFPAPDAAQVSASGVALDGAADARQHWAGWLIGVTVVYGLLPRLLLATLCYLNWRHGRARLRLDLELPAYQLLRDRLQPPSERLGVRDAAPAALASPERGPGLVGGEGAVLVGVELDPAQPWPPRLPTAIANAGVLDTREQRQRLLEQLTRHPPERLAIACDPHRSPDRGTLALLAELSRCAGQTRIWLMPPTPGDMPDRRRVGDWHEALDALGLTHDASAPLHWLEHGHD